jgi:hypothetical protein
MTRDENLNAVIQGLRSRNGLSAEYMQATKIEWPRPLAIGQPATVNAPARQARDQRPGLND